MAVKIFLKKLIWDWIKIILNNILKFNLISSRLNFQGL